MEQSTLYSTGHGNKNIDGFIAELNAFGIKYLMDIRSKPYSRWNPSFKKKALTEALRQAGIIYIFAGDALGGLPNDKSCYKAGKVDYNVLKEKDYFKAGLQRLLNAHNQKINLAIMCSEAKPEKCHRTRLIGQELLEQGISLNHIIAQDKVKSQETIMNELSRGRGTKDLFGNNLKNFCL